MWGSTAALALTLPEPRCSAIESGCSDRAWCVNQGSFKPLAITAQMEVMRANINAICQPAAPAAVDLLPWITKTAKLHSRKLGKQTRDPHG